jgi:CubicO group peptidase (beta-lactamase class C family)
MLLAGVCGNPLWANKPAPADVDALFAEWDRADVPGCTVGIIQDGALIYSRGFGAANLEHEVPNTPQTVFEIASATKSFTSACLALLMDQGLINPDDDVRQFLPELHEFDPPVRIRHMVQCHSGLWAQWHIMPLAGWDNLPVQHAYSRDDLYTVLAGQRTLPFEPGSQFQYSSGDYFWLGLVVERVSGQSLAEFAREHLFEPLGMTSTYYETDPSIVVKHRATGYFQEDGVWRQWRNNSYISGGSGVNTCIEDLARWDANFDDNQLPAGRSFDEFLREGTLLGNRYCLDADAYRKQVHAESENAPPGTYRGLKRIQFTGGFWGMTAAIARFPEQRFTAICLSNNDNLSPFRKVEDIADLYLADLLMPRPEIADNDVAPVELTPEELAGPSGVYRIDTSTIVQFVVRDGGLRLIDHLHHEYELAPVGRNRFRPVGDTPFYDSARFEFHRDPDTGHSDSAILSSHERGFNEQYQLKRIDIVEPTPEELAEYAGEYVSDELGATYRFKVADDALWLRVGSRRWEQLDPTVLDEFVPHIRTAHDQRFFRFERDDDDRLTGMSVAFWRIRGVRFEKRAAP